MRLVVENFFLQIFWTEIKNEFEGSFIQLLIGISDSYKV